MDHSRLRMLLARLSGEDADNAWRELLDEIWPVLLRVIRRVERDQDDAADCFLFVCEQLRRNDFARLRRFDLEGEARFTTWLELVAGRLCVDWHRRRAGRLRVFQSIARLPVLQREVFHAVHERGVDLQSAWATLRLRYPGLTLEAVHDADAAVRQSLGARDRRLMAARAARRELSRQVVVDPVDLDQAELQDGPADPESVVAARERTAQLRKAIAKLPSADRLLLKLRYTDELTLAEVARVAGLKDPQAADRRIREILRLLNIALS